MSNVAEGACPIVSVIVPVYNTARYLGECLSSLTGQTLGDIEVICIDDGSTDGSSTMLDEWSRKDARVRVIHQANAGVSTARNVGLDSARGKYVLFVDSDDYIEPNTCEKLAGTAERDAADIVVFGGSTFPPVGWIDGVLNTEDISGEDDPFHALFDERGSYPLMCNKLYRRELLEAHHLRFNTELKLGEDNAFQFCTFPHARIVSFCSDMFYHYRCEREGSAINSFYSDRLSKVDKHFAIVEYVLGEWSRQGLVKGHEEKLLSWASRFLYDDVMHLSLADRRRLALRFRNLVGSSGISRGRVFQKDDDWMVTRLMLCEAGNAAKDPALTVVAMPCPGEEELLRGFTLIANQSLQNLEIACVDDGSDETVSHVLSRIAEGDERVLVVPSAAEGLRRARGRYVLFARLEDEYSWRTFEMMLRLFDDHKNAEVVTFRDVYEALHCQELKRELRMFANKTAPAGKPAEGSSFVPEELSSYLFTFSSLEVTNKIWTTDLARRAEVSPDDPSSVARGLMMAREIVPSADRPYAVNSYQACTAENASALGRSVGKGLLTLRSRLVDTGTFAKYEKTWANAVLLEGMRHYSLMRSWEAAVSYLESFAGLLEETKLLERYGKEWFFDQEALQRASKLASKGAGEFIRSDCFNQVEMATRKLAAYTNTCDYLGKELERREEELESFDGSVSYRLGRALTAVPRVLARALKRRG